MNTIIDLNTAANVTFASQGSYSLNLGNVTGNGSVTVDRYEPFALYESANLVSVSNAVRDILIDVTANSVGVINSVNYIGPYANIGVLQITPFSWRVFGIRDVNRWDEAFANVRVSGNSPANYSFVTTVNDQAGNTRTWGTAVTVLDPPVFAVVGPVIYSEETRTVIGNSVLSITGNVLGVTTWTMYANVANTSVGQLAKSSNVNNTQSSISLTGNVTSLNSQIGANTIRFIPGSDLVSNVANAVSFSLVTGNVTRASAAANLQIANTVTELVVTSPLTYNEDQAVNLGNITITDSDEFASSYELILSQITANTANTTGRFLMRGADQGNVLSITVPAAPVAGSFANQPIVLNPANPNQVTAVGNVTTGVATGVMWSNTVTPGVLQINNTVGSDDHWLLATGGNIQFANTDTFTLESWAVATTSDTNRPILSLGQTTTANSLSIGISTTTGRAGVFAGNTTIMQSAANSVPLGVWKHIVVTHAPSAGNSVLNLYVQGVLANTYVGNIGSNIGNGQVYIGGSPGLVSLTGYMDEVRISNVARYPSSVTVPTTRFGYDANNMLLLHGNSNIGSNVIYNDAPGLFDITYQPGPDQTSNMVLQAQLVKTTEFGNTFTTTANIAVNIGNVHNDYAITTPQTYNEDEMLRLVGNTIVDTDTTANTYTVTYTQSSGNVGQFFVNGTPQGIGNSAVITANRATVNAANVAFLPFPDYVSNVGLTYSQTKLNIYGQSVTQAANVPITLVVGNTHNQYVITTPQTYNEDEMLRLAGNVIVDTDAFANTYTVTYAQSTGNTGQFFVNGTGQGIGNSAVITANRATINAANVAFLPFPDYTANVGLVYSQNKTTIYGQSVQQAATVPITLVVGNTHTNYSVTTPQTYLEDIVTALAGNTITDTDAFANTYTVSYQQVSGASGEFYVNGVPQGIGNAVSITANRATVNAANVAFVGAYESTANVGVYYNQSKTTIYGQTVQQASNVTITLVGQSQPDFVVATPRGYVVNQRTPVDIRILDRDPAYTYNISVSQLTPNSLANAASVFFNGNASGAFLSFPANISGNIAAMSTTGVTAVPLLYTNANNIISNAQSRFGNASINCVNTGNAAGGGSLYVPPVSGQDFGLGNYTVEAWIYRTGDFDTTDGSCIWSQAGQYGFVGRKAQFSAQNSLAYTEAGNTSGVASIPLNTWCHVAIVRYGPANAGAIYCDGSEVVTFTDNTDYALPGLKYGSRIGAWSYEVGTNQNGFPGFIDEVRVSNVARYTGSTYTVPSAAFTHDANTVVLIHADQLNYNLRPSRFAPLDTGNAGQLQIEITQPAGYNGNVEINFNISKTLSGNTTTVGNGSVILTNRGTL